MIYEYDENIVNRSNDFYDKNKFVGYILPDGSIFKWVNHNVTDVYSFFRLYLALLNDSYEKKDEILDINTNNKLADVVLKKLKSLSYDEVHALYLLDKKDYLNASELFVCYFGCHLVTRLKKIIITSEINHRPFYNYLLHDFTICTAPRLLYDAESKSFKEVQGMDRNDYLYDEINEIKNTVKESEIKYFHK